MGLGENFETTLEAARLGAEWAWSALYRDLAPAVTGYLRANGVVDPDDVAGEVFVRVVEDIVKFQGDESHFRSWVFVIAHHRMVDDHRRRARRPELPLLQMETVEESAVGDVESEAMQGISTASVERVIRRCAPDQVEVLLLRVLGGLTLQETADALGKTLGAVKALQRRGAGAIAREFEREGVSL